MNDQLNTYTPQGVNTPAAETATTALATQAKAMVESRYIMAMRNPRDMDVVRERMVRECKRPGFAASAIYHKPIGQGVEGPSIRFAEAAIRCMTNILPETSTIYDDAEKRIMRVSVTDLEANVTYTKDVTVTKTVERRSLKKGETPLKTRVNSRGEQIFILEATDDDILNKENALVSKALRTLGLRILPGDILDECMAICKQVRRNEDAKDPAAAKRALFDAFAGLGVSADQLKDFLGHKADVLQPKELEELRGLFAALRDGETSWREIIDARKPAEQDEAPAATTKPTTSRKGAAGLKAAATAPAEPAAPSPAPSPDPGALERPADGATDPGEDDLPL